MRGGGGGDSHIKATGIIAYLLGVKINVSHTHKQGSVIHFRVPLNFIPRQFYMEVPPPGDHRVEGQTNSVIGWDYMESSFK